jgi:hypothetical protein
MEHAHLYDRQGCEELVRDFDSFATERIRRRTSMTSAAQVVQARLLEHCT